MESSGRSTVEEHSTAVRELLARIGDAPERLPLSLARQRILAEDLHAPVSLPLFHNSQMDGYAIASAETRGTTRFRVADPVPAGHAAPVLVAGTAVPIMTGAMLPSGADAVVPIEQANPSSFFPPGREHSVTLPADVPAGQFVRPEGSDIRRGETALRAGQLLGPPQLGLAAALGSSSLVVRRRPRVLLMSTGDEVVRPGEDLGAGQIYDANTTILAASLEEAGVEVLNRDVTADSVPAFIAALDGALDGAGADAIITTGGISAGAYEVVRQALQPSGVEFVSVNMQPGGPQAIGRYRGVPFLGFPGNPVSAWVSFEVFLRPALLDLGLAPQPRMRSAAVLTEALDSPSGKHQFRRAALQHNAALQADEVRLLGGPGSHLLRAMSDANALVHVPPDTTRLEAGERVEVWITGTGYEGERNGY